MAFLDQVEPLAIHSMVGAPLTGEAGITDAADAYDRLLREAPPIDVMHLGCGPDGHTASLFPGSPALDERERLVVATGDELHPHPRLTVTLPAIARAGLAVFTVEGSEKCDALTRIRQGEDLPASRVRAERVLWLVDHAAMGTA